MWAALIPWLTSLFTSGAGAGLLGGATGAATGASVPAAASSIAGGGPLAGAMQAVGPKAAASAIPSGVASAAPGTVPAVAQSAAQKGWFTKLEDAMLGPEIAGLSPEQSQPARWAGRINAIAGMGRGGVPGAVQGYMGAGDYYGRAERSSAADEKRKAFEAYLRSESEKTTDPEERRALKIAEFTGNYSPVRRGSQAAPKTLDKPLGGNRYQRQMYNPETGALENYGDPYEKKTKGEGGLTADQQRLDTNRRSEWGWYSSLDDAGRRRAEMLEPNRVATARSSWFGEGQADYAARLKSLGAAPPAPAAGSTSDAAPTFTPPPDAPSEIDSAVSDWEASRTPEGPVSGPQSPSDALSWSDKLRLQWNMDRGDPSNLAPGAWERIMMNEANRIERERARRALGR